MKKAKTAKIATKEVTYNKPAPVNKRRILKRMLIGLGVIVLLLVSYELVRLYQLRKSIPAYRNYWLSLSQKAPAKDSLTYIALGDSAAQSIGASAPLNGYVGLVAAGLAQKKSKPVNVVNISVSGAKVQDVIDKQLPLLEKLKLSPETELTLDIGGNDMRSYNHDVFASQIDYLFSRLPKQTVVADLPYFGGGRANKSEKNAQDGSTTIEKVAKKYNLRVAPLHLITRQGDSFGIYAADFFHPNNKGYQNWYKAFWSVYGCNEPPSDNVI